MSFGTWTIEGRYITLQQLYTALVRLFPGSIDQIRIFKVGPTLPRRVINAHSRRAPTKAGHIVRLES